MSVFSSAFSQYTDERFEARQGYLAPLASDIEAAVAELAAGDEDAAALLRYWYATLPLSDVFDTESAVFASFARQAAELRRTSPWCRDVPEDVFIHFVASPRVNNEPLTDCWPTFRAALAERLAGLSAHDAVLAANYWCCETATYQASDGRTLGPLGVLASGSGRCGEESTYLVTALRANGIPARQIYTPWWAHCDDNHAWVEVYVDGDWHYLGACEPDEELDRGWFTAASGRAMLVHTRLFSDFACDFSRDGALLAREGSQIIVNVTERYAPATTLTIRVVTEEGAPVTRAHIRLALLNESSWRDMAHLATDATGEARIVIGEGTLRVFAATGDLIGNTFSNSSEQSEVEVVMHHVADAVASELDWASFDHVAPSDHPAPSHPLTDEQVEAGRAKKHAADALRVAHVESMVCKARELAQSKGFGDELLPYFENAFGNAEEVASFLSGDEGADRAALLSTLTTKDFRDLKATVLEDHLLGARAAHDDAVAYLEREGAAADEVEELYTRYVLSPRASIEQMSPWRSYIRSAFSTGEVEELRNDPLAVWSYVCEHTSFDAPEHVKKLIGTPRGALTSEQASPVTARMLFVAICRSFGIAARVNPVDDAIEYYTHGRFVPVELPEDTVNVAFSSKADPAPGYFQAWSVARLQNYLSRSGGSAQGYVEIDLSRDAIMKNGLCTGPLPFGTYRLTTGVRLPNGNVQGCERLFIVDGTPQFVPIELKLRVPSASEMLEDIALEPFTLDEGNGYKVNPVAVANICGTSKHPVLVSFLEPGMEPTEHLLNELREQVGRVVEAELPLLFVLKDASQLADPTLSRTLDALSEAQVTIAYNDFSELPEKLARRMFANPEKLPLSILAFAQPEGTLQGVYATAGYNVGTVDLILQLLHLA